MAKKLDLQEYGKALTLLKGMVEKMVPIKKTQFLADHKLSANFFRLLEEMGVITLLPDISNRKEGYRYDWHYRKADNETDSHLALRLTGRITEEARKAHVYYTTDAYKKKKAISDYKKDEKEPVKEWDSETQDIKGTFPTAVEIEVSLVGPKDRTMDAKVQFNLETPNDILPKTY